jgi:PKD repeat protein
MKKFILILVLALSSSLYSAKAQCAFTHIELGNTTTISYLWPIAGIYSLDSVRINFGDGNSILQVIPVPGNAQHTYANPGTYNVCLTRYLSMIGNPTPIVCNFCDSVFIGGLPTNCVAQANFGFVNNGLQYNFISASACINCTTQNYTWDFGDGTILTNAPANVNHTYANPGFYNVCLTVNGTAANNTTCTNTSCQAIVVTNPPLPCSANASYTSSVVGSSANFTNTSTCTGCTNTMYVWDFGDGSLPGTTASPSHTYATPGTYTVCLTITGMDSVNMTTCVDDTCMAVAISGIPGCTAVSNFTNTNNVNVVQYTSTGTCTGCTTVSYAWTFGDGGTSTLPNPTHTYAANGNYNVCLTLSGTNLNNQPCSNQLCRNVLVSGLGINEASTQRLNVYPNPATQIIHIELPQQNGLQHLSLFDMYGRAIHTVNLHQYHANTYAIKLNAVATGMYTIQLNTTQGTYREKVLIQQ